ncbi:sulfatase-like hydrolase/transferase [Gracilibacillus sp. YIM 98692]|uniref:sulfatase-like hydrolase/transferase n=1 Tax=Gracilibacillus sp. YIM 98692 TaxID=2663532 RepID=UPI0013CF4661|nr:sulfatase-like hydrolase/transferase [Gracilibacillus sp. YIM 98692]
MENKKKPNIIIFNVDQWRGDLLGHMGNPAAVTPHLDKIVETDAVSFRNAFCQNPVCTPSRCSFMSGWYPHVRGHRTMYHMMQKDEPVLLKTLKEAGYYVWWGGRNDLVPAENGFDDYCNEKYEPRRETKNYFGNDLRRGNPEDDTYYSFYVGEIEKEEGESHYHDPDWENVMGAIDFIKNPPADKPMCMYLPLLYPHVPFGVESPWYEMIDRDKMPERIKEPDSWDNKPSMLAGLYEKMNLSTWSEKRWAELRATYYAMCTRVDHQFGMLVEALKEQGLYEDTAIFFFSDHGEFAGDYGVVEKAQNVFQDCLTKVPFIIKPPSSVDIEPGVRDSLVELVDFTATVEDLTEVEPNHFHFGKSLVPIMKGEKQRHRDAVFSEGGRLKEEIHCNEDGPMNRNPSDLYWPRGEMQRSQGPEHTKATMVRTEKYKYIRRLDEKDELYDLEADPEETINLIDDASYKEIVIKLKERMLTFYQETCDVVPLVQNKRF